MFMTFFARRNRSWRIEIECNRAFGLGELQRGAVHDVGPDHKRVDFQVLAR
jgi:hypothetical protein